MIETIDRDQVEHKAQVAADNALWHRRRYRQTGDRYNLGQWKAYARCAWCLRRVEYTRAQSKRWYVVGVALAVALGALIAWLASALA